MTTDTNQKNNTARISSRCHNRKQSKTRKQMKTKLHKSKSKPKQKIKQNVPAGMRTLAAVAPAGTPAAPDVAAAAGDRRHDIPPGGHRSPDPVHLSPGDDLQCTSAAKHQHRCDARDPNHHHQNEGHAHLQSRRDIPLRVAKSPVEMEGTYHKQARMGAVGTCARNPKRNHGGAMQCLHFQMYCRRQQYAELTPLCRNEGSKPEGPRQPSS